MATTTSPADDAIVELCASEDVAVHRGSEADVLGRFVVTARAARADVVVRVTADCPLIDPGVTDRVVDELTSNATTTDYASNVLRRTYPRGLDVEAMFLDTLLRVDRLAVTPEEREHVTITIRSENPRLFVTRSIESEVDDSDLRWTIDEPRDLELVSRLYAELGLADRITPYECVVRYVRENLHLTHINAGTITWTPSTEAGSQTEVPPR